MSNLTYVGYHASSPYAKTLHPFNLQFNITMPVAKTFRQLNTNSHVQWKLKTCIKPN